jgi:serine/threonine-protein kinase
MLHRELSIDASIKGRFLREGYVANKVGHAGAVSEIDDDTAEDGAVYLVMDLLEGETLDGRAQRGGGKLDPSEVLAMADQLLDVLAAAHDKGIVHRDIKPENVFITREGVIKVLDFGIARVKELSTASTATRAGSTMGTPAFMPPEQARGRWEEVDARSDLWAVGATMHTLLTSRLVHEAHTVNEQLLAAMTAKAPSISAIVLGLPPQAIELIDRSLAFDRKDRWPDARTMQNALRIAYQALIGNPIATAPKLTVPEIAMANTLAASPGMPAGRPPTTAKAMVSGQTGVDGSKGRSNRLPMLVAVAAASFIAAVGVVITIMMTSGVAQAPASTPSISVASEVRPELTAPPSAPPQPNVVSIEYFPTVTATVAPAKPDAGPGKKLGSTAPTQASATPIPPKPVEADMDKRR